MDNKVYVIPTSKGYRLIFISNNPEARRQFILTIRYGIPVPPLAPEDFESDRCSHYFKSRLKESK